MSAERVRGFQGQRRHAGRRPRRERYACAAKCAAGDTEARISSRTFYLDDAGFSFAMILVSSSEPFSFLLTLRRPKIDFVFTMFLYRLAYYHKAIAPSIDAEKIKSVKTRFTPCDVKI